MPISTLITATDILVSEISTPSPSEQRDIIRSFQWINRVLKNTFGVETFVIDAAFSKALLPHEPIEITQFLSNKDCTQWSLQANQAICQVFRTT